MSSAKERVLAVHPDALWHQPMDANAGAIFRDGLETYGATHLSHWLPKEEAAWADAASRLPSPQVEGDTQTPGLPEDPHEWHIVIYNDVVQYVPATYENGWWYWADHDADPCPVELISGWISIRQLAEGQRDFLLKMAALRDDNKEAKHG